MKGGVQMTEDIMFYKEWLLKKKEKNIIHLHFTMDDNPRLSPKIRQRYRTNNLDRFRFDDMRR